MAFVRLQHYNEQRADLGLHLENSHTPNCQPHNMGRPSKECELLTQTSLPFTSGTPKSSRSRMIHHLHLMLDNHPCAINSTYACYIPKFITNEGHLDIPKCLQEDLTTTKKFVTTPYSFQQRQWSAGNIILFRSCTVCIIRNQLVSWIASKGGM